MKGISYFGLLLKKGKLTFLIERMMKQFHEFVITGCFCIFGRNYVIYQESAIFALMKPEISDWNVIPYAEAWKRQTEWFDALVQAKQEGESM